MSDNVYDALSEVSGKQKTTTEIVASRKGQKLIGAWHDPVVQKQLKILSAETGRSIRELHAEALNMLFERHGKNPIA